MTRKRLVTRLVCCLAAGIAAVWWWSPSTSLSQRSPVVSVAMEGAVSAPVDAAARRFLDWAQQGLALKTLPRSLQGTAVDGGVRVDANGHLVPDPALRRLFDYFLAAAGEESLERIRARIAFYLQQHLPLPAALEAWDVLNRYLDYKDALATLPGNDGSFAGMKASLAQQRQLRDSILGPELGVAFYRDEDIYADFALQHVEQLRDSSLTPAEREQQTEALLQALPPAVRNRIEASAAPVQVEGQVDAMRRQGVSDARIWQVRDQHFGGAAADRLAQLDRTRAEWEQRYQQYRQQRQQIMDSAMAQADREAAIAQLQSEDFSQGELKRVQALDRIAAEQAAGATR